jgi:hypothetical protein
MRVATQVVERKFPHNQGWARVCTCAQPWLCELFASLRLPRWQQRDRQQL